MVMRASAERRRTLLVAAAADIGQRLFALRRDEIVREGRALAGGWPGTLREARALAIALLAPVFAQRHMSGPTTDELGWVMHAAYSEARRAWLTSVDRREEPEV
jgi:hypothetical protein